MESSVGRLLDGLLKSCKEIKEKSEWVCMKYQSSSIGGDNDIALVACLLFPMEYGEIVVKVENFSNLGVVFIWSFGVHNGIRCYTEEP